MSFADDIANLFKQPISEQWLLDDRDVGSFRLLAQRWTKMTRNQNRGGRKMLVPQLRDQVEAVGRGGLLVNDQTIAPAQFAGAQ